MMKAGGRSVGGFLLGSCLPGCGSGVLAATRHLYQDQIDSSGIPLPMTDDPDPNADPDKLKGPGGMTLRQIHEQVQKSVQRDRQEQAAHHAAAPPQSRWQRWVRYVWGRSGRR